MRRWAYMGIWLAATAAATSVAWLAVAAAGDEVSAQPLVPVVTATTITGSSSTSTTNSTSTTSGPTSTTGTSDPTSVTPPTGAKLKPINTAGGKVIVSYTEDEVRLSSATPNPGFDMEIEDAGPEKVDVRFRNDDTEYRVEVRWESGELTVDVNQSGEENHEGEGSGDD